MKKIRASAAKRFLLGRLDVDEVPFANMQSTSTSWSETLLVDAPSTTGLSHDARGDCMETKATEQHEVPNKNSNPCPSTSNLEDGTHVFSTTRRLSKVPRLQKWSPTSVVKLSMIVVALAVAVVLTLVFAVRDKKGGVEVGHDQRNSGVKVASVAKDANATTATSHHGVFMKNPEHHHDMSGGDQQHQDEGSYHLNFHKSDELSQSAQESSQAALSSSSTSGRFVWLNDDGFGPRSSASSVLEPAPSGNAGDSRRAPAAPSSPDRQAVDEYDRRERRLGRVDRKTYLKNVDLRLLHKN